MKNFFPENISPKLYSLSAVAVGYLLIDDLDAIEQNALGNWLMLAAQVICTNAYFKQLKSARESEKELSDEGRIFVRPSGTQSLLRVMTEAPTQELADKYCEEVAKVVEEEMGSN